LVTATLLLGGGAGPNILSEHILKLLASGVELVSLGGEFGTALQAASLEGTARTITLLLENNADPNIVGEHIYYIISGINVDR
jgi:hypothetical protein